MTVRELRAVLGRIEAAGLGDSEVCVSCDVTDECPDGESPFGVTVHSAGVLLDYTAQPDAVDMAGVE